MNKQRLKLLLWLVIGLLFAGVALAALSGLGQLVSYFQEGADPSSALNIVPNVPPDLDTLLVWLPDDADTGREMEPLTRRSIEASYLRSWLQWNLSYERGQPFGLKSYFAGPALEAVRSAVNAIAVDGLQVNQINTEHQLQLHFYSADGSIVAFTDRAATVAQLMADAEGDVLHTGESTMGYEVVMFLEDGNWRVRHWVRTEASAVDVRKTDEPSSPPVQVESGGLTLDGQPFTAVGTNYYPAQTPWDRFWPEYDEPVITADLARMVALGMNTVRIFVPFEQFGGPEVEPEMLERLGDFLDRAAAAELYVIVTLFDFRTDYRLLFWPAADRHLETILAAYGDHPAVLAWDLKNEPDLDYDSNGAALVNAWLVHAIKQARQQAPDQLLTIGWSTPEAAVALSDQVDLISFHYYRPVEELEAAIEVLRDAVADRPILLTEFGQTTWDPPLLPVGGSAAEQADHYAAVLTTVAETSLDGYLNWTLYDFAHVPVTVAGRAPWRRLPQAQMGIVDLEGREKPAAAVLRAHLAEE